MVKRNIHHHFGRRRAAAAVFRLVPQSGARGVVSRDETRPNVSFYFVSRDEIMGRPTASFRFASEFQNCARFVGRSRQERNIKKSKKISSGAGKLPLMLSSEPRVVLGENSSQSDQSGKYFSLYRRCSHKISNNTMHRNLALASITKLASDIVRGRRIALTTLHPSSQQPLVPATHCWPRLQLVSSSLSAASARALHV
jgi:hypothetical protein